MQVREDVESLPMKQSILSKVTIVLPVLNEADAIGKVIDEILSIGIPSDRILVIDGGSTDGTLEIARSRGVKTILQEGRGKADAIRTALKFVDTEYTLVMDGDYTYPAKYIPLLLSKIEEGYDEVIGKRIPEPGAQSITYKFGNWVLTKFFNLLFGTRLSDILSGMYVVRTKRLRELNFECKGFSVESEIAAHIAAVGGKIIEIPITYRKRIGKKKLRILGGLRIALDMLRLSWRYNPLFTIFALSSVLLVIGLVLGSWVAYQYLFFGVKHYVKGLIAVLLTLTGLVNLAMAVLALYIKRMEIRILRKIEESFATHKG